MFLLIDIGLTLNEAGSTPESIRPEHAAFYQIREFNKAGSDFNYQKKFLLPQAGHPSKACRNSKLKQDKPLNSLHVNLFCADAIMLEPRLVSDWIE